MRSPIRDGHVPAMADPQAGPAVLQDAVRRATAAVSTEAWEDAVAAWYQVAASGHLSNIATAFMHDSARRWGRLDIVAACAPRVGLLLRDSPYLVTHQTQIAAIEARRKAAVLPSVLDGLAAEDLRRAGALAMECQLWRRALPIWEAYGAAGGAPADVHAKLGQCHASLGAHAAAIPHLLEAQRLAPGEQVQQRLARSERLHARAGEPFDRHAQRLADNAVVVALRDRLANVLEADAGLALAMVDELARLSAMVGVDLLPLARASAIA